KKSLLPLFKFKSGLIYGSSPEARLSAATPPTLFITFRYPAHAGARRKAFLLQQHFLGGYG
ncbi:hypothetical protein, partial [Mailhella sp.]|uniref:hypothetical protein n=1 Tax=Mailhella sp. TaxID=1981029 RepID=UPI003AB6FA7F